MSSRFNWRLWSGFVLCIAAFVTYFVFFIRFPITRDMPWASLILFALAIALLVSGLRQATGRRIVAWIVTVLGIFICAFFCFAMFIGARWLPASANAPGIGAKAPDFVLRDSNRASVSLSKLLAEPATTGVVLIFYRGYW